MVRVHKELAEVCVRVRQLTKTVRRIAFAIKPNVKEQNVTILVSYMKSFLAYCIFVLQVSEVVEAEQVNTPVDPDGEVQLFKEQTSTTQIETLLLFAHKYTVVCIELLTKHYLHKPECCLYLGGPRVGFLGFCLFLFILIMFKYFAL